VQVLTEGALDDSPSFAPNGKMILYEASVGGRGNLAAVSWDGRVRQRLTSTAGDVQDPAWGPMPTN
jgi:TolB protein